MYERFTDRARKVMYLANNYAHKCNKLYVSVGDLLIGLIEEGHGVAAGVFKNLDIDLSKARKEIEKLMPGDDGISVINTNRLPHAPILKKVIEYSIEEARNLNHNYVGTEHLLLGLLREQEGVAAQVLMNLGLKLEDVREEVLNLLGHNIASCKPDHKGFNIDDLLAIVFFISATKADNPAKDHVLHALNKYITDWLSNLSK